MNVNVFSSYCLDDSNDTTFSGFTTEFNKFKKCILGYVSVVVKCIKNFKIICYFRLCFLLQHLTSNNVKILIN